MSLMHQNPWSLQSLPSGTPRSQPLWSWSARLDIGELMASASDVQRERTGQAGPTGMAVKSVYPARTSRSWVAPSAWSVVRATHVFFTHPRMNHTSLTRARASQARATTLQTPSAASLARSASFALLARRWACAARWRTAQRMGVARGRRVIASARWATTWTRRRAACPAMRWARIAPPWE